MSTESEAPAKNYQITALTTAVGNLDTSMQRIESKIDNQLVTKEKLEAELLVMKMNIESVDDKYAPIKKSISKVTWIVIGVIVPLVVMSGIQFINNLSSGTS